ncbi:toll/interleukin-1 receptor domain-containing protein [Candidatus Pacearchaeota archaeon]|nr:toll/interleukin-1 receptor domain-containing protein [Candidatus Pacearchaeota archaeon]
MKQFKIFISYSSTSMDQVMRLKASLEDNPIDVFVAENSVLPGEDLTGSIKEAIEKCDIFLLVWTKSANDSRWVNAEVSYAFNLEKFILPIVYDKEVSLPVQLQNIKYIDAPNEPTNAINEVRDIIMKRYSMKNPDSSLVQVETNESNSNSEFTAGNMLFVFGLGMLLGWLFTKND